LATANLPCVQGSDGEFCPYSGDIGDQFSANLDSSGAGAMVRLVAQELKDLTSQVITIFCVYFLRVGVVLNPRINRATLVEHTCHAIFCEGYYGSSAVRLLDIVLHPLSDAGRSPKPFNLVLQHPGSKPGVR
jgi:hypothetical protein